MIENKKNKKSLTMILLVSCNMIGFLFGCKPDTVIDTTYRTFPSDTPQINSESKEFTAVPNQYKSEKKSNVLDTNETEIINTPRPSPSFWQEMPVIPEVSRRAIQIYKDGITRGNNPHSFSKIGDCESRTTWFFYDFDMGEDYYTLGEYSSLKDTIDYFKGSFSRLSMVAKPGFTAASVMVPIWADKEQCDKDESPIACEYRLNKPSIAFIMLGTNDVYHVESFEENLRLIIDYSIETGVLPILATKADNLEGDHFINSVIARLAYEYDIPLWNFWASVQTLPDHGLQKDGAHLTWAPNQFDNPKNLERAWPLRNLTGLQVLDKFLKESLKTPRN